MSAPLSVEGGRTTSAVHEQQQLGKTAKSFAPLTNQRQAPGLTPSGSVRDLAAAVESIAAEIDRRALSAQESHDVASHLRQVIDYNSGDER